MLTESGIPDVRADMRALTVDDVAECLRSLKLGRFIDKFREHDVDGRFLQCLDERMLVEEFSMPRIEARKLALFACGWRPNTGGRCQSKTNGDS
jgi:hypothetical protein